MEAQKKECEKHGETKKKRQLLRLVKGNGGEDEEGERKEGRRGEGKAEEKERRREKKKNKEEGKTESTKNRKVERDIQDIVGNPIQDS